MKFGFVHFPRKCSVERSLKKEPEVGKTQGRLRPRERFMACNEDVGGVVLCLRPVSIMDLASQLAIDRAAHDLVRLLFSTIPVCQPATKRWKTEKNLLPDDRHSVQVLPHYPPRWSEVRCGLVCVLSISTSGFDAFEGELLNEIGFIWFVNRNKCAVTIHSEVVVWCGLCIDFRF